MTLPLDPETQLFAAASAAPVCLLWPPAHFPSTPGPRATALTLPTLSVAATPPPDAEPWLSSVLPSRRAAALSSVCSGRVTPCPAAFSSGCSGWLTHLPSCLLLQPLRLFSWPQDRGGPYPSPNQPNQRMAPLALPFPSSHAKLTDRAENVRAHELLETVGPLTVYADTGPRTPRNCRSSDCDVGFASTWLYVCVCK